MSSPIPQLRTQSNGIAHWEEVAVGSYVIVRFPFGALANKEVLLRKRSDGKATLFLMPDGGAVVKSERWTLLKGGPVPLMVGAPAPAQPPTKTVHAAIGDDDFALDDPSLVQANDGVYRLPPAEAATARAGTGGWGAFPAARLRAYGDEQRRYGHDMGAEPLDHWSSLTREEAARALHDHLTAHGSTPSDQRGYDLMTRLPTGQRAHINVRDLAARMDRGEGTIHGFAALPALHAALAHPGQIWQRGDADHPTFTAFGFPHHGSESDPIGRHFPAGVAATLKLIQGAGDRRDLAVKNLVTGMRHPDSASTVEGQAEAARQNMEKRRHGSVRYVAHPIGDTR